MLVHDSEIARLVVSVHKVPAICLPQGRLRGAKKHLTSYNAFAESLSI